MGKDLKGKELGEGLCQCKDGRYLARYTDRYGKRHNIYGKKLKEVREKYNKAVYESKMGLGVVEDASNMSFDELYQLWFKYKLMTVKISTCATYKQVYNVYLKDTLGCMKVFNINKGIIQEIILNASIQKDLSYSRASLIKAVISNIFKFAIDNDYLINNPLNNIILPKNNLRTKAERKILNSEQRKWFIDYAERNNYRYLPICKFMLLTGARINEVLALTWADVDFDNNKVNINKTIAHTRGITDTIYSVQPPKSKSSRRIIPLCTEAVNLLINQKSNIKFTCKQWVFSTRNGTPVADHSVTTSLNKLISEMLEEEINMAKLEEREPRTFPHITPHSFRHTFATMCFENGMDYKIIQKILGHSTLAITMDLYTHVNNKHIEESIAKIDEVFCFN